MDIWGFGGYERRFGVFERDLWRDIEEGRGLVCLSENEESGESGLKIWWFLKWGELIVFMS